MSVDATELVMRAEMALAREARALDALERLLPCVDRHGFSTPEQQQAVREAAALLAEVGR